MRLIVIFVLAVALTGCSLFSKKPDTLIIPGERIGSIRIGMHIEEAVELMEGYGPVGESSIEGGFFNTEAGVGLSIFEEVIFLPIASYGASPGIVRFVITDDKRFKTADGQIGAGLPAEPVIEGLLSLYGKPTFEEELAPGYVYFEWKAAGIGMTIDIQGARIYSVSVYAPTK